MRHAFAVLRRAIAPVLVAALTVFAARAVAAEQPVALSATIGDEIDRAERDAYHLFPDVPGFISARIVKLDKGYRVDFTYRGNDQAVHEGSRRINDETFDNTRLHVGLVEAARSTTTGDAALDARVLHDAALRMAADGRYDLSNSLFGELRRDYPAQYDSLNTGVTHDEVVRLQHAQTGLFRNGSAIDKSGRTDVLVFAGYYGVWLAIGVPVALNVESSEGFAAFLLTVPVASIFIAHQATKNRSVSDADAEIISLGGWFGTWQGVGWSAIGDGSTEAIVGTGVLGGLTGIGLGCVLNHATELSAGHAAFMNSANWWGGWLGMLVGAGQEDGGSGDDILGSALVGSTVAVAVTGLAARNTPLTQRRVRYMNMGGVLGALFGGGLILLADTDSNAGIATMLGVSSVAGGFLGVRASRPNGAEQSRSNATSGGSLALENSPTIQPFTGWSRKYSEARVGFEVRF